MSDEKRDLLTPSRRMMLGTTLLGLPATLAGQARTADAPSDAEAEPPREGYVIFNRLITDENVNSLIAAIEYLTRFSVDHVTILVSSTGGSVEPAVQFYNYAMNSDVRIDTMNTAQVASAANILYLAGAKRYAPPSSYFFMHPVANANSVSNATLRSYAELQASLSASETLMRGIYKARTTFSNAEIDKFFSDQVILEPAAAVAKGLATDIRTAPIKGAGLKVAVTDPPGRYFPLFATGD